MGWYYGFKLHLVVSDRGEILACRLTPGNVDDRQPVLQLIQGLFGKLFGDRGYVSLPLVEQLLTQAGVRLITKVRKNMREQLVSLRDKLLLRKRAIIESVNDQLKNRCQFEHSRRRSPVNFAVRLLVGLCAYCHLPKKPSLDLDSRALALLAA
jgi:hypothetical protein